MKKSNEWISPNNRVPDTNELKVCYINGERKILKYVKDTEIWWNVWDSPGTSYKKEDVTVWLDDTFEVF